MQKNLQHIVYHNCHYPNPFTPIQCISLITKYINPLDVVNISPYHPPEKITKVSTTERNIINNMKKQINNIMMGITSTGSNTAYPITNINCPMLSHLQGFQLYHLTMMVSWLQVWHNERKWYLFNLDRPQYNITTGTKYYTWLTPHHTSNLVTHVYKDTNTGNSNPQAPKTY